MLNPLLDTRLHFCCQHTDVENQRGPLETPMVYLAIRRRLGERETSVPSLRGDTRATLVENPAPHLPTLRTGQQRVDQVPVAPRDVKGTLGLTVRRLKCSADVGEANGDMQQRPIRPS
jgi:hypothetical protein